MGQYHIKTNDGKKIKLKQICNKYNRSDDEDNDDKKQSKFRLLGYWMRCNGKMDVMIDVYRGLCNQQFMKLRSFVNYKKLRLNAAAIWKLGQPVIQALIEFGAKFYSKESKVKVEKLYNYQYKLARYCLGARSSCPKRYLEYELNFDDVETRTRIVIMENFEAAKRAPMTYMKGYAFNEWINYLNLCNYDHFLNWKNNDKTHIKTLLSRGYLIWCELNKIDRSNWSIIQPNQIKEVKYSLPIYTVNFPRNISLFNDFDAIKYELNNHDSFNWWTDGSLINDSNYGGFGLVTLQQREIGKFVSNYGWINHKTNINYCELVAIEEVLNEMCNDDEFLSNNERDYLTILTDSMFCLYQLDLHCYCKYEYYYNVLMRIFRKCNFLWQFGKHVRIVKVPAHEGLTGNELADFWAKVGAGMAAYIDEKCGDISNNDVPLIVQNEINRIEIKKMRKEEKERIRKAKIQIAKEKKKKRIGSTLYESFLDDKSKHCRNEKKYLSFNQSAIMLRLRSEHIELNKYNNVIYAKGEQTSDKCDYCDQIETVEHFICHCEKFSVLRNVMIDELKQFDSDINCIDNNGKIKIKRLLFPHAFQDKAYLKENILKRVKQLKIVCNFVKNTGRFNNDRVKTKIFKQYGKQRLEQMEIKRDCDDIVNTGVMDIDLDEDLMEEHILQLNENFNQLQMKNNNFIIDDNG